MTRYLCIGFVPWKRAVARLYLPDAEGPLRFASVAALRAHPPPPSVTVCAWGDELPEADEATLRAAGNQVLRVEDGFIRSVGLGSDFRLPASLCLDTRGVYFDATRRSDLEVLLETAEFPPDVLSRAGALRVRLISARLTKYNFDEGVVRPRGSADRRLILVPAQVPGDASLRLGMVSVAGNVALLKAVRAENPDAFLVFKVHPDVASGNRPGGDDLAAASELADLVTAGGDMASWLEVADEVHTATSLAGFEALLRGRPVTTWGLPFYAGWGLTTDKVAAPRRTRRLTLDELVAGALILYPRYADPATGAAATVEQVVEMLATARGAASASPRGGRRAWLRRQARSLAIVAQEFTTGWKGR